MKRARRLGRRQVFQRPFSAHTSQKNPEIRQVFPDFSILSGRKISRSKLLCTQKVRFSCRARRKAQEYWICIPSIFNEARRENILFALPYPYSARPKHGGSCGLPEDFYRREKQDSDRDASVSAEDSRQVHGVGDGHHGVEHGDRKRARVDITCCTASTMSATQIRAKARTNVFARKAYSTGSGIFSIFSLFTNCFSYSIMVSRAARIMND